MWYESHNMTDGQRESVKELKEQGQKGDEEGSELCSEVGR